LRVDVEPLHVRSDGEVIVASPSDERVEPVLAEACDEVGAEESSTAGDQDAHTPRVAVGRYGIMRLRRCLL
jgi:hypothetical protein